jgi:uncharacterized protein (TIGR03382 family)
MAASTRAQRRLAGLLLGSWVAAMACSPSAPDSRPVDRVRAELGEPTDGFPSWEERVVLVWSNRARSDPQADLSGCDVCAEKDCYDPVPPLVWSHDLGRAARFHSDNLQLGGCANGQHDSPCTLRPDLGSAYDPGPCDGSPSCACKDTFECGSSGTSWSDRIQLFSSDYRSENVAWGYTDPVDIFYAWLHEPDSDSSCGFRTANGHRYNILTSQNGSVGVGASGDMYTQDFGSNGSPDGLVSGVHYPETGSAIEFRANWYRGSAPSSARVNLDGSCHAMSLERGSETNGTYLATVDGLGSGCHRYYFHFTDGSEDVFYPTTGALGIGCSTEWTDTRADPCGSTCSPNCDGKECGGDGCGGTCGSCGSGESCDGGTCVSTCSPDCSGKECGGDGCGGSCGSCNADRVCSSGSCVCGDGLTECGGSCVDTSSNIEHCGQCGNGCGSNETCSSGTCSCVPECSGRDCGGDGCGGSCGSCNADRVCSSGSCVCGDGLSECGGQCVDLRIHDDHCGACGNGCEAGESCQSSTCMMLSSDAGSTCTPDCTGRECGGDTCGGSCGSCPDPMLCGSGGLCACPDGETRCGESCVDLRSDPDHCGACDRACGSGARCVGGSCEGGESGAVVADGGISQGGDGSVSSGADGGLSTAGNAPAAGRLEGDVGCSAAGDAPAGGLGPLLLLLGAAPLRRRIAVRSQGSRQLFRDCGRR